MKTPAEVGRQRSKKHAPSQAKPRSLQLPLSRTARQALRRLVREAQAQLRPETKTKLRAFAKTHGYRPQDVLEAAVVLSVAQRGGHTEVV